MSLTLLRTSPLHFPTSTLPPHPRKSKTVHFPCFSTSKNNNNGGRIAGDTPDLAAEVMQRIKAQFDEQENAMKKSKKMLFVELCNSLNLSQEEGKKSWGRMSPDEKMAVVKGFVCDWGSRFHPLSPRSVRDMVDEYVAEDADGGHDRNPNFGLTAGSDSGVFFPGLKKLFMGLSQDD